jgi:glucose-1-phosphate thymidylyltransferase
VKGIILAGGTGSRLDPLTRVTTKQLLPIYDKPMIYYPLFTLMSAGISEVCVITRPDEQHLYMKLLGDGKYLGINITYTIQDEPRGIPEAFILCEEFLDDGPVCLILGDNIFVGPGMGRNLSTHFDYEGATAFACTVANPEEYGNVLVDENLQPLELFEKPIKPTSKLAVTGLYFFDKNVVNYSKKLSFSERGEIEIIDLLKSYLETGELKLEILARGIAWFDAGTPEKLFQAAEYIRLMQNRQDQKYGVLEEIAFRNSWITEAQLEERALENPNSEYSRYIKTIPKRLI